MLTVHAADVQHWVLQLLWPLTRILGCIAAAPLFNHPALPKRVKLILGLVLAFAIAPGLSLPEIALFSWEGLWSLICQCLIGISMGFVMRLFFSAVEMAGFMTGMSMGLGFASFYDPQTHGQNLAIGQFLMLLTLLVFLSLDGHLLMVATLAQSFSMIPVQAGPWQLNSHALVLLGAHIFSQGLLLALPVIASLLVTNMALGILTKAAPQLNLFGIGFPITIGIGLVMLWFSLPAMVEPVTRWMIDAQPHMLQVLQPHTR